MEATIHINTPATPEDLEQAFGTDDEVSALGPIPSPLQPRLDELASIGVEEIALARDWEGCIFGIIKRWRGEGAGLDVLAFTSDGRIGSGGINHPIYFNTVPELLADNESRWQAWKAAQPHPAAKFKKGQHVELLEDVDRYPHFIAHKGAKGTVVEVDGESISIRMDEHINGAEEWDNEVMWTYEDLDYIDAAVRIL